MKKLNRFLPALIVLLAVSAAASNLLQDSWHVEMAGLRMSLATGEAGPVRIFFAERS